VGLRRETGRYEGDSGGAHGEALYFDDLRFNWIPEPPLAILVFGLIGFAWLRRGQMFKHQRGELM